MAQYTFGLTRLLGHGHAFTQKQGVTSPAAGAGFTYTNSGRYWELADSLSFQMVTGSNAANRQIAVTIKDGDGIALATLPAASVQTASLTWQYTFARDFTTFNTVVGLAVTAPLPALLLQPMYSVVVTVGAVDAADQISNVRLYLERFVTGAEGYLLGVLEEDDPRLERYFQRRQILA